MRAYPPFFRYDLISASISQFALLCKQKYGAAACLFGCPACPSGRKRKKPDGRGRMRAEQAPLYTLVPTWFGARKRATNEKVFLFVFGAGVRSGASEKKSDLKPCRSVSGTERESGGFGQVSCEFFCGGVSAGLLSAAGTHATSPDAFLSRTNTKCCISGRFCVRNDTRRRSSPHWVRGAGDGACTKVNRKSEWGLHEIESEAGNSSARNEVGLRHITCTKPCRKARQGMHEMTSEQTDERARS